MSGSLFLAETQAFLKALASETLSRHAQDQALRAELASLDTGVMAAEAELTARGDTDLSDEMVRVEQLRERARGISAVLVERRRSMERDRGQLMDSGVVANLEADAQELRQELTAVEAEVRRRGGAVVEINVDGDDGGAPRFYRRHGYRNTDIGADVPLLYFFRELAP